MINDNVVRRGTANENKVTTQLMRWENTSFLIQNQPSHLASHPGEKFAFQSTVFATDYISSGSTVTMDKSSQHETGLNFARRVMNCGRLASLSCSTLFSSPGESPMQHSREDDFSGLIFDLSEDDRHRKRLCGQP
jgi:hypothetical protein